MNILVHISHPAQFHLFKNVVKNLENDGHHCFLLIKSKDVLEDLAKASDMNYFNIMPHEHRNSRIGILFDIFTREVRMLRFVRKHHIDILIGSTAEVAQIGWLTRKKRINFGEDDMHIVPLFQKMAGPFIQTILSPFSCNNDKLEPKSVKYAGFHKLSYLHPNYFTPDISIVKKYIPTDKPYFILRFAKLKAYHDVSVNAHGINTEIAQRLIDILSNHGNVFISSERELEPQFEQYRLCIDPSDMHHILAFANIYAGDSQSMAVESAMLGTPSLRFNDFAGKIGVLEELEKVYKLTYAFVPTDVDGLMTKIEELLNTPSLKEVFQKRREKMLADKIDVTAFFTWFIENYPQSRELMQKDPSIQYQFK